MRDFNYSKIKEQKWDSEVLAYIAAIYKEAGKQELYLKQRPEELEKLVDIAKIQSTEASNAIEGIITTKTRIKQLVEEKTTPRNRDEQEIAGYRDVLNTIHESSDAIPITRNYILQLHKIMYSHMNNPMSGRTKNVQNYISATYPDGHSETLFTPMSPFETPEALDRICTEYNRVIGNFEVEPLIVIPVFIHEWRQRRCINLIPSENSASRAVQLLCASDPAFRYAEHKKIKSFYDADVFYYQGTKFIDRVEQLLVGQMKQYLGCSEAETRVLSGQMSNMTVFSALMDWKNRLDRKHTPQRLGYVLNNHIIKGGHLSAQPMNS